MVELLYNITTLNLGINKKVFKIQLRKNRQTISLLTALWNNKFILGYTIQGNSLFVFLKYNSIGTPHLKKIQIISKPSRGYFIKSFKLNNKILVLSTNAGFIVKKKNDTNSGKMMFNLTV